MYEDRSKCCTKPIRVIIHGGDCNLNREIMMNLQRFSLTSLIQSQKPAGIKDNKGESTQEGLNKK
jgi:hypothetical protein